MRRRRGAPERVDNLSVVSAALHLRCQLPDRGGIRVVMRSTPIDVLNRPNVA